MHLKLICSALFAVSLGSTAFAAGEEYVEVLAPNECCDVPAPLMVLTGWGGSAASLGAATFREAALNAATQRAAQQRAQQQQQQPQEQQQNSQYNDAIQNKDAAKQSNVWDFLMNLTDKLLDGGRRTETTTTTTNDDGSITETKTKDCKAGGPLNPNNRPCTEHRFELFVDPLDGMEKWSYTMSVVEGVYRPIHYDADKDGYYGKVIGKQTFTLVFQTKEDFLWQLQRVGGRH